MHIYIYLSSILPSIHLSLFSSIYPPLLTKVHVHVSIHLLLTAPEIKLAFGVEVALVPSQPWIQAPDHLILSSTGYQMCNTEERGREGKKGV